MKPIPSLFLSTSLGMLALLSPGQAMAVGLVGSTISVC